MPKPTPKQREVLTRMVAGEELRESSGMFRRYYIGQTKLAEATVDSLLKQKWVSRAKPQRVGIAAYITVYSLTEAGREVIA